MMKASDRRKLYSEEIKKRQEEGYARKDGSGRFKSIFIDTFEKSKLWKCSEAEHSINIVPYLAGKQNPHVAEGKPTYILDIYRHAKVGVNEDSYICMKKTYDKPCPICEYQAKLRKESDGSDASEDYIKSFNAGRRAIYNVHCLDSAKEEAKGIQIWEVSHFLFEKEILEIAKKKRGGGFVYFADIDDGKIVSFRRTGSSVGTKFTAIEFEERDAPISDELIESALCLDEMIYIPDYEEVKNAFYSLIKVDDVEEEEEETTRKPKITLKAETNKEEDVEIKDTPETVDTTEEDCPFGYEFGKDFDRNPECDTCLYDDEVIYRDCELLCAELRVARKNKVVVKEETKEIGTEDKHYKLESSVSKRRRG